MKKYEYVSVTFNKTLSKGYVISEDPTRIIDYYADEGYTYRGYLPLKYIPDLYDHYMSEMVLIFEHNC